MIKYIIKANRTIQVIKYDKITLFNIVSYNTNTILQVIYIFLGKKLCHVTLLYIFPKHTFYIFHRIYYLAFHYTEL
jgi:hypothetical protein